MRSWDEDERKRDRAMRGQTGKGLIFLFGLAIGNLIGFVFAGLVFLLY